MNNALPNGVSWMHCPKVSMHIFSHVRTKVSPCHLCQLCWPAHHKPTQALSPEDEYMFVSSPMGIDPWALWHEKVYNVHCTCYSFFSVQISFKGFEAPGWRSKNSRMRCEYGTKTSCPQSHADFIDCTWLHLTCWKCPAAGHLVAPGNHNGIDEQLYFFFEYMQS